MITAWARGWAFGRWWLNAMVVGGPGAGTFMTMSRTGWLGFLVGVVVAVLFVHFRDRVPWPDLVRLIVVAFAVGVFLVAGFWVVDQPGVGTDLAEAVEYRLTQGASLGAPIDGFVEEGIGAQDTRSVVWPRYVNAYQTHPISGIGLGVGWATPNMQEPHNLGLQLLGETGLVGLFAFAGLAYVVLRWGGGTIGAIALVVVASTAMTQTVLFEPTLWFSGALYLGKAGVDPSKLRSSDA
jgi:O-antigen ligase